MPGIIRVATGFLRVTSRIGPVTELTQPDGSMKIVIPDSSSIHIIPDREDSSADSTKYVICIAEFYCVNVPLRLLLAFKRNSLDRKLPTCENASTMRSTENITT